MESLFGIKLLRNGQRHDKMNKKANMTMVNKLIIDWVNDFSTSSEVSIVLQWNKLKRFALIKKISAFTGYVKMYVEIQKFNSFESIFFCINSVQAIGMAVILRKRQSIKWFIFWDRHRSTLLYWNKYPTTHRLVE